MQSIFLLKRVHLIYLIYLNLKEHSCATKNVSGNSYRRNFARWELWSGSPQYAENIVKLLHVNVFNFSLIWVRVSAVLHLLASWKYKSEVWPERSYFISRLYVNWKAAPYQVEYAWKPFNKQPNLKLRFVW